MDVVSLICLSIGLSMDAFVACIANGATTDQISSKCTVKLALCFGFFHAGMSVIGSLIGKSGERFVGVFDHWIAMGLLVYIGLGMII